MKKLIAIVGPTASGKSDLAVAIALQVNGEVISADSRQVYKGLDIGSGKITREEMQGIPHHMLDVVEPTQIYNVAQYQKDAQEILENIWERGKTPIVCGGTGMYIEALVDGTTFPEVPPNKVLRNKLRNKTVEKLQDILKEKDPERLKTVDKDNPVRLVRAIEIAEALGAVPKQKTYTKDFDVLMIGLKTEKEVLKKSIHDRLQKRLEAGMIEEVEWLHNSGVSWERLESLGLEYKYIALYLQEKISKEDMLAELETKINQYAKRQITWFKRDERITWLSLRDKEKILRQAQDFVMR